MKSAIKKERHQGEERRAGSAAHGEDEPDGGGIGDPRRASGPEDGERTMAGWFGRSAAAAALAVLAILAVPAAAFADDGVSGGGGLAPTFLTDRELKQIKAQVRKITGQSVDVSNATTAAVIDYNRIIRVCGVAYLDSRDGKPVVSVPYYGEFHREEFFTLQLGTNDGKTFATLAACRLAGVTLSFIVHPRLRPVGAEPFIDKTVREELRPLLEDIIRDKYFEHENVRFSRFDVTMGPDRAIYACGFADPGNGGDPLPYWLAYFSGPTDMLLHLGDTEWKRLRTFVICDAVGIRF